jgi:hypothetical protein
MMRLTWMSGTAVSSGPLAPSYRSSLAKGRSVMGRKAGELAHGTV